MRITFLGTGTSHGVPTIDCLLEGYARCPYHVCRKAQTEPRYRRTRASILVETAGTSLLVDTSQDFREQMLVNRVMRIDAVLYTHGHADHIYGLPDIRSYCHNQNEAIDIYGSEETLAVIHEAFSYIFHPPEFRGGGIPAVTPHRLEDPRIVHGVEVVPIHVEHGPLNGAQGYRIGGLAYLPDVKRIPPESLAQLQGVDTLVINCLRHQPHGSHLSLGESLAYVEALQPRRCYLTHMTHDIDYQLVEPTLPDGVRFAYDGLTIDVP